MLRLSDRTLYLLGLTSLTTLILTVGIISYRKSKRTIRIVELWIYPIKGCAGIKLDSSLVIRRGFKFDRGFMFVDKENRFVSQRTQPKMALIETRIDSSANILHLSSPGIPSIELKLSPSKDNAEERIDCTVWSSDCQADVVKGGGEWFCQYLGVPIGDFRLVRMAENFVRKLTPEFAPEGLVVTTHIHNLS